MTDSDITLCSYSYYNSSSTVFTCTDRYATSNSLPTLDTTRDTVDVSTGVKIYYDYSSSLLKATFEAKFYRKCTTSDSQDNDVVASSNNNIIWAFGSMSSGTPSYHGSTATSRGTDSIFIKPANGGIWFTGLSLMSMIIFGISMLYWIGGYGKE